MYKEMNTLDNLLKMISKFNIILGPISLIFSILTLLNIDAVYFIYSKAILILLVVVLSIVQIYFWAVILIPIIKLSIFNWKIK